MVSYWKSAPIMLVAQCQGGDEMVFYHVPSGSVHLVNALGMKVLNALSEKPLTLNELVDTLQAREINIFSSVCQFLKFGVEEGFIEEIQK